MKLLKWQWVQLCWTTVFLCFLDFQIWLWILCCLSTAVTIRMIGLLSPPQSGHEQQLGPRDCPGVSPIFAGQTGREALTDLSSCITASFPGHTSEHLPWSWCSSTHRFLKNKRVRFLLFPKRCACEYHTEIWGYRQWVTWLIKRKI